MGARNYLRRRIRVPGSHDIYLSDRGLHLARSIVAMVDDADVFDGDAEYGDISTAFYRVIGNAFVAKLWPADFEELVQEITPHVAPEICNRTFVASAFGLKLSDGVEALHLGASLTIVSPSADFVRAQGVDADGLDRAVARMRDLLWITGTFRGTPLVARRRFNADVQLAVGVLAISAASTFEHGAHAFRIGALLSAEDSINTCETLFWNDKSPHVGFTRTPAKGAGLRHRQSSGRTT